MPDRVVQGPIVHSPSLPPQRRRGFDGSSINAQLFHGGAKQVNLCLQKQHGTQPAVESAMKASRDESAAPAATDPFAEA